MNSSTDTRAGNRPARPIEQAKTRTEQVQQDLEVAGAELDLSNTILERKLPESEKHGDVAQALEQSGAVEEKVQEAAHELQQVTGMLAEEVAERERLERELKARASQ